MVAKFLIFKIVYFSEQMKMSTKLTGYDFWNIVLKSPQYVAAPMVDMSELAFRMLCRRYKAQLCFSPMLHSQQYIQDSLYRSDTFSTCPEDKPLIVQVIFFSYIINYMHEMYDVDLFENFIYFINFILDYNKIAVYADRKALKLCKLKEL